jgi:down-regulator of transcription 1
MRTATRAYANACIPYLERFTAFHNTEIIYANSCAATVAKIVTEILANDPGVTFAKDTRDLLIECCVEFITLISSEANDIAEKEAKKTIACEHVQKALEELGFGSYVKDILDVATDYKKQQAVRAS